MRTWRHLGVSILQHAFLWGQRWGVVRSVVSSLANVRHMSGNKDVFVSWLHARACNVRQSSSSKQSPSVRAADWVLANGSCAVYLLNGIRVAGERLVPSRPRSGMLEEFKVPHVDRVSRPWRPLPRHACWDCPLGHGACSERGFKRNKKLFRRSRS